MTTLAQPPVGLEPAYAYTPPRVGTYGPEAVDLIRLAGRDVDAEQAADIDAFLSFGPGGRLLGFEQATIEARQNGKTDGVVLPVVVFDLWELCSVDPDRIVWTAHLYKTAQEAFESVCNVIDSCPDLSRDVKKITFTNGEQGVELNNGASLEFIARSEKGGRGLGGRRLILDEAMHLAAATMGAAMPVLSARPNPQIMYASSAAKADSYGARLRSLVTRGRAATHLARTDPAAAAEAEPVLIYRERCAPGGFGDRPCAAETEGGVCDHGVTPGCVGPPCEQGTECSHLFGVPGCAMDRQDYWIAAGHSTGRRVTFEYVAGEARSMRTDSDGVREFGRERLGWHEWPPDDDSDHVIDMEAWDRLADVNAPAPDDQGVAIGIDVPPDVSATSIAVAWWWAGRRWVMVHRLNGTIGAPRFLRNLWERGGVIDMGLQASSKAGLLLKPFAAEGLDVRAVSSQEVGQGVSTWLAAVRDQTLGHLNQPELHAAQKAVKLRRIGDAVIWARDDLTDLSPLYAATIALNSLGVITEEDTGPNIW